MLYYNITKIKINFLYNCSRRSEDLEEHETLCVVWYKALIPQRQRWARKAEEFQTTAGLIQCGQWIMRSDQWRPFRNLWTMVSDAKVAASTGMGWIRIIVAETPANGSVLLFRWGLLGFN